MTTVYDFSARTLDGRAVSLGDYRGRVLLIVNTASKCGFTPQFEALEKLYEKLEPQGLTVLGFPCNQFGKQEPGSAEEIGAFCQKNYGVSFPMFEKIEVNGAGAHPLYKFLTRARRGILGTRNIKWNFTKFLVNRGGEPLARYGSGKKPEAMEGPIQAIL